MKTDFDTMNLTFEEAKSLQQAFYKKNDEDAAALRAVPGVGSGEFGMTPDDVKFSDKYQIARMKFDASFNALRKYNAWFTKKFKKERAAERRL